MQYLPPEWAPQSAVQITWPHADSDWADDLEDAEACFAGIAREVSRRQTLLVSCHDAAKRNDVEKRLRRADAEMSRVRLFVVPSNDVWARDHGPITVVRNGAPLLLNFRFNGWGGKFRHDLDDRITHRLAALGAYGRTHVSDVDLILEGGAVEANGNGCLLTTERCLLSATRNSSLDRAAVEARLRELFGVHTIHWLTRGGLQGDDTDGHIDTLARFSSADTIVFQDCDDIDDEHFDELEAMVDELEALRQPDGKGYRLLGLPWPQPQFNSEGRRLPATYANFLILNTAVLLPVYGDPADAAAAAVLRQAFPGREVVGVDCRALIRQFGSLHCVTMQLPAGVVA